jgi:hypothetical protein
MLERLFVRRGDAPDLMAGRLSDRFQNCLDAVVQVEPLIDFTDPFWMFDHVFIDDSAEDAEAQPVQRRTRKRKPTLAGVARQAAKAGIEVARFDVRPDGTIGVVIGKPTDPTDSDINDDATTSPDPKWN